MCMLDHLMCTFKAYVLESTLLEIQNPALTSRNHLLKFLVYSTKGDLSNSTCTLDYLMCTFKAYMLESTLLRDSKPCSDLKKASPESFRSFYQRRPLEYSMHIISSNVHIQSLRAWEHTFRDSKPCSYVPPGTIAWNFQVILSEETSRIISAS